MLSIIFYLNMLSDLNCFHTKIKFSYEIIGSGDLLLVQKDNDIKTIAYRKPTRNDMYLHWDFLASELCKQGILKILLLRAHILCSNQYLLEKEIKNLEHVFRKVNG